MNRLEYDNTYPGRGPRTLIHVNEGRRGFFRSLIMSRWHSVDMVDLCWQRDLPLPNGVYKKIVWLNYVSY